MHRGFCLTLICSLAGIVGCGGSGLDYAPLSGVITIDGKPVASAQIVLLCDEIEGAPTPTCRAMSDQSGQFTMKTLTPEKKLVEGAVVGTHRVAVTTQVVDAGPQGQAIVSRAEMLPAEITEGKKLTITVPSSGKDDWQLAL